MTYQNTTSSYNGAIRVTIDPKETILTKLSGDQPTATVVMTVDQAREALRFLLEGLYPPASAPPPFQEIETLGVCLRRLAQRKVRPTEALCLLIGRHEWMSGEQAQERLSEYRSIDLSWDAYLVEGSDQTTEAQGIYLFAPGGPAYCAFDVEERGETWYREQNQNRR